MHTVLSHVTLQNRHLVLGGEPALGWPPSPHDPRDRETLDVVGDWLVLQFPATDQKLEYFARFSFLHLQLWHPVAEVSVLTPSRLTLGCYELHPHAGNTFRDARRCVISSILGLQQLTFPSCCELDHLFAVHLTPLYETFSPPPHRR